MVLCRPEDPVWKKRRTEGRGMTEPYTAVLQTSHWWLLTTSKKNTFGFSVSRLFIEYHMFSQLMTVKKIISRWKGRIQLVKVLWRRGFLSLRCPRYVFYFSEQLCDSAPCSRVSVLSHAPPFIISSGKIPWLRLAWLLCLRWRWSSSDSSSRPVCCLPLVLQGRDLWEPVWWSELLRRLLLQSTTRSRSLSPSLRKTKWFAWGTWMPKRHEPQCLITLN